MRAFPLCLGLLLALVVMVGCESERTIPAGLQQAPLPDPEPGTPPEPDVPDIPEGPTTATLNHSFGAYALEPFQEISPCVSWTLNNDAPIYVERVTLSNNGGYHHSNWFVVPEDAYPGEDGFWRCRSRNFDELGAALQGTVLFAQSTQSLLESQFLDDGVVIKIPPRSKIVADVHMLNLAPREHITDLRMSLDAIHPRDVEVVVTPFRLSYLDLNIPPLSQSRFTGTCGLSEDYRRVAKRDFDMKIHWVLPHYHQLGDFFELSIVGGPRDGEVLYNLDGFNADANGKAFKPPVDMTGAEGLRFTCGYNNTGIRAVGWGIGDQEMCVMLGFMEGGALLDASVVNRSEVTDTREDVVYNEGPCIAIGLPRNENQGMPTEEELSAPLAVPELGEGGEVGPIIECEDTPDDAVAEQPVSFESIQETVFGAGCSFNACHDRLSPAAGLPLDGPEVFAHLVGQPSRGNADMLLVDPGKPEQSWLYQVVARCEPSTTDGVIASHMPLNAPGLIDPGLAAKIRDWIAAGAPEE